MSIIKIRRTQTSQQPTLFIDWYNKWRPYVNPYRNAGFHGTLFEHFGSFGEELERVKQQDPKNVWSLTPVANHGLHIVPGIHPDAEGYFIVKHKRKAEEQPIVIKKAYNCYLETEGLGCCPPLPEGNNEPR